jgi:hypothetical protein
MVILFIYNDFAELQKPGLGLEYVGEPGFQAGRLAFAVNGQTQFRAAFGTPVPDPVNVDRVFLETFGQVGRKF